MPKGDGITPLFTKMGLKCQQSVNADLNRNVFRCCIWLDYKSPRNAE